MPGKRGPPPVEDLVVIPQEQLFAAGVAGRGFVHESQGVLTV